MFRELYLAITHDFKVAINRGTCFYVMKGLLHQQIDRTRKYKKQSTQL